MPMNFGRVLLQRGAEGKLKNPALFDGWCGSGDSAGRLTLNINQPQTAAKTLAETSLTSHQLDS